MVASTTAVAAPEVVRRLAGFMRSSDRDQNVEENAEESVLDHDTRDREEVYDEVITQESRTVTRRMILREFAAL
ncbi:hypothetical protein GCM10010344_25470 [Streptomyces bluensis]|nr:hypothetical protein GCM10010344_25470 [Streptomyces bluensis]